MTQQNSPVAVLPPDGSSQHLYKLAQAYGLPQFVKDASLTDVQAVDNLGSHMFADPLRRRFPCHSAAATWISAAAFAESQDSGDSKIEHRIKQAAAYFGVLPDVENVMAKIAADNVVDEDALPDDVFAIVRQFEDGTKQRHYPLRNTAEIRKAAEYVVKHRRDLRFADRHTIASKVLEKAAEFGADIAEHRDMLEKLAARGICAKSDAIKMIDKRVRSLRGQQPKIAEQLQKLAETIDKIEDIHFAHESFVKLAEIIDDFDHQHRLVQAYGDYYEPPEDVLFAVTEKLAAEQSNALIGTVTGNYYRKDDLRNVSPGVLRDHLGDDFAETVSAGPWLNIEKFAEIVPTLPRDDAEVLDIALQDAGITPFAQSTPTQPRKKSAASGLWAAFA